jgi:heavy metal efflux system protein
MIREACHEVQRPVFYAIAIIITAYLPIFTLQRVEGRLFRPMAWTVAFALLGAMTFSILIAPVLAATFFRHGVRERRNLVMDFLVEQYRRRLRWAVQHRWLSPASRSFPGGHSLFGLWRGHRCGVPAPPG